jgi:hypothetical protein
MHLGEPAAEIQAGSALRQGLVGERVEGDDLATGGLEELCGLGVAEREGASAGHGDHGAALGGRREVG